MTRKTRENVENEIKLADRQTNYRNCPLPSAEEAFYYDYNSSL
jgi:hypothetical protein